jgi:hypothetical protein
MAALMIQMAKLNTCGKNHLPYKPKIFTIWLWTEKFVDPALDNPEVESA